MCDGCAWEVTGPRLVLLLSCFGGGVGGVKYCWGTGKAVSH